MAFILSLPVELLAYVTRDLSDDIRDVAALSRSCRAMHSAVTHMLYKCVKDDPSVMCWAVDEGRIKTVERLLAAGADPNVGFVGDLSRMMQLKCIRRLDMVSRRSNPLGHDCCRSAQPEYCTEEPHTNGSKEHPNSLDEEVEHNYEDGYEDVYDIGEYEEGEETESDTSLGEDDSDEESETSSNDDDESFAKQFYWSPIHIAARWGQNDIVDLLLQHGADIHALSRGFCNCSFPDEASADASLKPFQHCPLWMPLHTAICYGNDSTARLLLSRGASTNVSTRYKGWEYTYVTALHTACFSHSASFSRFLLESGYQVNVEIEDHMGCTPMSYAYYNGNWASIDLLLEHGATLNARIGSFSLIKHACLYGRYAEAARLLELGANINTNFEKAEYPKSALYLCCVTTRPRKSGLPVPANHQRHLLLDVVKTLNKMRTNRGVDDLSYALLEASKSHLPDVVQLLLDEGADVYVDSSLRISALQLACASNITRVQGPMLRTVQILLSHMCIVRDGHKALEKLCANVVPNGDKEAVAQLLLKNGAAASLERRSGQKLLSSSIANSNFLLSEAFINAGLRNPKSRELKAIIGDAIFVDNELALEYLLTKFPDSAPLMLTGRRLFDALKAGKEGCALFLAARGAPIDFQQDGETCLFYACGLKRPLIAEILLDRGADPNACTDDGNYPILPAILNGDVTTITLLLDHGAKVHQHPNGGTNLGPFDLAITSGNLDSVNAMIRHSSYWQSTQKERNDHLLTACFTERIGTENLLRMLLGGGDANPNAIFEMPNCTPLHLAIVTENKRAISLLVEYGGDIHLKLVDPDDPDGSGRPFTREGENPFAYTTPMEFALRHAAMETIEHIMSEAGGFPHDRDIPLAHYMRAVCYRLKPDLLALMLAHGVSVNIQTEDGNAPLGMLCEGIDEFVDAESWVPSAVAERSVACMQLLLGVGTDPSIKNHKGESGLDQVRRRMTYADGHDLYDELTRCWNKYFIISESSIQQRPRHEWA